MEEYFFQMEDTKIPIYLTDGLQEIADKITENGCNRVILVYDRALDDKLVDELGTIINKRVLCSKIGVSIDENAEEFKELHTYYTTRSDNLLKKMQSLIVIACKLL